MAKGSVEPPLPAGLRAYLAAFDELILAGTRDQADRAAEEMRFQFDLQITGSTGICDRPGARRQSTTELPDSLLPNIEAYTDQRLQPQTKETP